MAEGDGSAELAVRYTITRRQRDLSGLGTRVRGRGHVVRTEHQLPDRTGDPPSAVQGHQPDSSHGQVPTDGQRDDVQSRQLQVDDEGTPGLARTGEGTRERRYVGHLLHNSHYVSTTKHHGIISYQRRSVTSVV